MQVRDLRRTLKALRSERIGGPSLIDLSRHVVDGPSASQSRTTSKANVCVFPTVMVASALAQNGAEIPTVVTASLGRLNDRIPERTPSMRARSRRSGEQHEAPPAGVHRRVGLRRAGSWWE